MITIIIFYPFNILIADKFPIDKIYIENSCFTTMFEKLFYRLMTQKEGRRGRMGQKRGKILVKCCYSHS